MKLTDFAGQKKAVELMDKALKGDRVNHAYLFYGPEESGKFTFSLTMAKALNCREGKGDSCNSCISCGKIDRGIHPDVSVVEPEGKGIKIEQIRRIKTLSSFRPNEGEKKIYLLKDAHTLSLPAANSLLGILEEPPSYVVFILLAPQLSLLPDTVVSRCLCIPFNRVPRREIYEFLKKQKSSLSDRQLWTAAHLAEGSIGRAVSMLNSDSWSQQREQAFTWWKGFIACSQKELFSYVEELSREEHLLDFLNFIESYYRDCLIYQAAGIEELIVNIDYLEEIKEMKPGSNEELIQKIEVLENFKRKMHIPLNKKLALEAMLVKMKGVTE